MIQTKRLSVLVERPIEMTINDFALALVATNDPIGLFLCTLRAAEALGGSMVDLADCLAEAVQELSSDVDGR